MVSAFRQITAGPIASPVATFPLLGTPKAFSPTAQGSRVQRAALADKETPGSILEGLRPFLYAVGRPCVHNTFGVGRSPSPKPRAAPFGREPWAVGPNPIQGCRELGQGSALENGPTSLPIILPSMVLPPSPAQRVPRARAFNEPVAGALVVRQSWRSGTITRAGMDLCINVVVVIVVRIEVSGFRFRVSGISVVVVVVIVVRERDPGKTRHRPRLRQRRRLGPILSQDDPLHQCRCRNRCPDRGFGFQVSDLKSSPLRIRSCVSRIPVRDVCDAHGLASIAQVSQPVQSTGWETCRHSSAPKPLSVPSEVSVHGTSPGLPDTPPGPLPKGEGVERRGSCGQSAQSIQRPISLSPWERAGGRAMAGYHLSSSELRSQQDTPSLGVGDVPALPLQPLNDLEGLRREFPFHVEATPPNVGALKRSQVHVGHDVET